MRGTVCLSGASSSWECGERGRLIFIFSQELDFQLVLFAQFVLGQLTF